MTKANEYVGVDEKYIPEDAQEKTHVQEPIIGSENAQKIRDGITGGVNYLTSDNGKAKVKSGIKKGWTLAKAVIIGRIAIVGIISVLFVIMMIVSLVTFFQAREQQSQMVNNYNSIFGK